MDPESGEDEEGFAEGVAERGEFCEDCGTKACHSLYG